MPEALSWPLKEAPTGKLAESLELPLPEATPRQLHGAIGLPGKATAVNKKRDVTAGAGWSWRPPEDGEGVGAAGQDGDARRGRVAPGELGR